MTTTSAAGPGGIGATSQPRPLLRVAAGGAVAATVVNAGLWVGGRVADVSFSVTPVTSDTAMQVGLVSIVATTLVLFAVGSGLLSLASRRSHRWARIVVVAAAVFTVVSISGPLSTAQDAATGVLLAAMHLATGAVFLTTASRLSAR